MSHPSPFRLAETIRAIGSPLPIDYRGKPYSREEHARASEAWLQLVDGPLPVRVENGAFFSNNMFDTSLLAIQRDTAHISLTVDEDDAFAFSNALRFFLDLPRTTNRYPVDLVMHGPSFVRTAIYDNHGFLQDVTIDWGASSEKNDLGTLTNEWFFDWGDHIGWVAETWGVDPVGENSSGTTYLLVDCARASACDRRLEVLQQEFGPAVRVLWEDAQRDLRKRDGARLFWGEELYDYLPNRLVTHGLTRDRFLLPPS